MSRHADGEWSICRLCRKPIYWRVDANGRPKPFDDSGSGARSHFLSCIGWRERCRKRDAARRAEKDAKQGRLF